MARTSDLQDFNRGPSVVGGDYLWQPYLVRGTICGSHTWSGRTDYGGTIDGMTEPRVSRSSLSSS